MNTDPTPANGQTAASTPAELQAEVDRLRASLREAEERIADLQQQRDKYYEFTKAWIAQNCKDSDWDSFDPADYVYDNFNELLEEMRKQYNV